MDIWFMAGSTAGLRSIEQRGWPSAPGLTPYEIVLLLKAWFEETEDAEWIFEGMYDTLGENEPERLRAVESFWKGFETTVLGELEAGT